MNRMVISPLGLGLRTGLSGRFGHVKLGCTDSRTRDSEIDSSNYLFGVYWISTIGIGTGETDPRC